MPLTFHLISIYRRGIFWKWWSYSNLHTFPDILPLDIMSDDPGGARQTFFKIVRHVRRDRRILGSLFVSRQFLPTRLKWVVHFGYIVSRSTSATFTLDRRQTTFYVVRSGSPVFVQNSKFGQIHLSISPREICRTCRTCPADFC